MFRGLLYEVRPARLLKDALVNLVFLALIGSSSYSTPQGVSNAGKPVPLTRLVIPYGTSTTTIWDGQLSAGSRIVVRDRETRDRVWKQILGPNPPPRLPPLPEIDFSREMLIAVGMGQKRSNGFAVEGGYQIIISSARELDNRIEVEVQSKSPCGLALGVGSSWPVDIVRIPKTELPVTFREVNIECKDR
ncbi:MAG TPA: protease complex subunit PrcB family protein [Pyrinomonadaceae bacterium]|nr:protease complex subunit PrcB family protein [Pyrinomonadaceae bacterium]